MNEVSKTIFYLFVLGAMLIAVGYYGGTKQILQTVFSGVNTLDMTASGRNSQGNFAPYASNGPK